MNKCNCIWASGETTPVLKQKTEKHLSFLDAYWWTDARFLKCSSCQGRPGMQAILSIFPNSTFASNRVRSGHSKSLFPILFVDSNHAMYHRLVRECQVKAASRCAQQEGCSDLEADQFKHIGTSSTSMKSFPKYIRQIFFYLNVCTNGGSSLAVDLWFIAVVNLVICGTTFQEPYCFWLLGTQGARKAGIAGTGSFNDAANQ